MTLRRYAPMRKSRGTVIPDALRKQVLERDGYECVAAQLGMPHVCSPGLELDHVRASGALGRKSRTTLDNLVALCPSGHRYKTVNGRAARPLLIAYIESHPVEHPHVEIQHGCPECDAIRRRLA